MKRNSLFLIFIALTSFAFAQNKDARYYMSKYDAAFDDMSKRLELIEICREDIKENAANALAYPYLCWAASYYGRNNTVIQYYQKMMSTNFSNQNLYSTTQVDNYKNWVRATTSEAYLRIGNNKRCIEIGEDYLNSIRDYNEGFRVGYAYRIMAEAYVNLGELHNAAIAYTSAVYYRPDDVVALRGLADTNFSRGLKADALENYNNLIENTRDSSVIEFARGRIKQIEQESQN